MDNQPASDVVLLSIKPQYSSAILDGNKRVEFRKARFHKGVRTAVIYACRPIQGVVGYFNVSFVDTDSPENLWKKYGVDGAIERHLFDAYYNSMRRGVAIGVGELHEVPQPIPLTVIGSGLRAPQSFQYFENEHMKRLLELSHTPLPQGVLSAA